MKNIIISHREAGKYTAMQFTTDIMKYINLFRGGEITGEQAKKAIIIRLDLFFKK